MKIESLPPAMKLHFFLCEPSFSLCSCPLWRHHVLPVSSLGAEGRRRGNCWSSVSPEVVATEDASSQETRESLNVRILWRAKCGGVHGAVFPLGPKGCSRLLIGWVTDQESVGRGRPSPRIWRMPDTPSMSQDPFKWNTYGPGGKGDICVLRGARSGTLRAKRTKIPPRRVARGW